ncbi:MAG TPA: hypothetical protein VHH36_02945 [Candidatus Thermoplasmatota archaeon]|nr:hypothetical protein [Candidatus Thermoplasmatota archaeon]
MRRALLLAALLLAAPSAQGEHVYSHKLVVEGRLIGADGLPIPGREVRVDFTGAAYGPCRDEAPRPVTDEWGDFRFCYHAHDVPANVAFDVAAGNATAARVVDTLLRAHTVVLEDATENGTAPPEWNATYRIGGRVWRAGAGELEGVPVYGVALADVGVNVTLLGTPGNGSVFRARTDGYGDFGLTVRLEEGVDAADVTVEVEALGRTTLQRLDERAHRNAIDVRLPTLASESPASRPAAPPGSSTPSVDSWLVAGVAVAAVAALALAATRPKK